MNSEQIGKELEAVLLRYRASLIPPQQAKEEMSLLQSMLKAYEQTVLEEKLNRIEALIGARG